MRLDGKEKIIQLLECCDKPLRRDLTRSAGRQLTDEIEENVFSAIKQLAIQHDNMIARVTLYSMKQDREEPIRSFSKRLWPNEHMRL